LVLSGKFDEALAVAEEMEVEPYRDLVRARVAQERGDPAQALQYYDSAFRLWPNNPWARYAAAGAAEDLGDFDRALEEYRYSVRIDPLATDARVQVARLLIAEGKPNEALQVIQVEADQEPHDLAGELVLLEALGADGRVGMAAAEIAALGARQPAAIGRAAAVAARAMNRVGGHAAAIRFLHAAPGLDLHRPAHADALRALVDISAQVDQLPAAMQEVADARRAAPQSGAIRAVEARAMTLAGAPASDVQAAFEQAVAWSPDDAAAWLGLGLALAPDDPERAMASFDRALMLDASLSEDVQLAAADLLLKRGDRVHAEERLAAALEVDPYSGEVAFLLATLRLERGVADARTAELAARAVRFGSPGRAAEARSLADRVGEAHVVEPEPARIAPPAQNAPPPSD